MPQAHSDSSRHIFEQTTWLFYGHNMADIDDLVLFSKNFKVNEIRSLKTILNQKNF